MISPDCPTCGAGAYWRIEEHADWCEDQRRANASPPLLEEVGERT